MPVTLYDGGTQNTTINLKNGNGNALGTGFGFGTINGNDILVNSNDVEGNLELVQVIDMSNYTFEEISNYPDEVFVALKNFLVTNKIRAVGVEPIYSSASKMIAATLLLKDGQFALKSITNDGQGTVALTFIEHGLSGTTAVVERIVDATLTYTNGVPTSLDELINDTYTTSLGDIITLTPASATQGTLTPDEVNELTTDTSVKLQLNNELYYLNSNQHTPGVLVYTNNDYENQKGTHKYISVTISTRGWVMTQDTGGGSDLYMHEVGITDGDWRLQIAFPSTSPTKLTIEDILRTKLNTASKGVGSKFVDTSTRGIAINAYYFNYNNQDAVSLDYIDITEPNNVKYYSSLRIPVSRWSFRAPDDEYPTGGYIITKIS